MSSKPQKISSSPKQNGNEEKIIDKIIQDLEGNCIIEKITLILHSSSSIFSENRSMLKISEFISD
jgi:hypothetical protein